VNRAVRGDRGTTVVSWAYGARPLPLAISVVLPEGAGTPDHLAEVTDELHSTVPAASHELGRLA
jgi:hypothetical protein